MCRHCQIAAGSDFSTLTPTIFCGKRARIGPLIVSGCSLADPRHQWIGNRDIGGDRHRDYHAVADAFLRANYDRLPLARLAAMMRRSVSSIQHRASRLHITHGTRARTMWKRNGAMRRHQNLKWTDAQIDFLRVECARALCRAVLQ